jgi:hypothetical protein
VIKLSSERFEKFALSSQLAFHTGREANQVLAQEDVSQPTQAPILRQQHNYKS